MNIQPGIAAATTPPTFVSTVFNDPNNDPDAGNYATLLAPFLYDTANANNNVNPPELRALVNGRANNMDAQAMGYLVDNVVRVILCPKSLEQPLGSAAHTRWNTMYAFDGDLLGNTAFNVVVDNGIWGLIPNIVDVPTVGTITAAVGGDPGLEFMGPYVNGDAGTETIRVRKIIPIPHIYTNIFLTHEVTPRFYFETIYPQMVLDGKEGDCIPLHRFFQVAITRPTPTTFSTLNVASLVPVGRDPIVHRARLRLLHLHLPALSNRATQNQANAIATNIANLVAQNQQFRTQDVQAKQAASARSVEDFVGTPQLAKLLRYCQVNSEGELPIIWTQLAAAKKQERLGIVSGAYASVLSDLREHHLSMVTDMSVITTMTSLAWEMATKDSIKTGIQPFRFPDLDVEVYQQRNAEIELMLSGSAHTTLADARSVSDAKLILPSSESSLRYVRRLQVWSLVWLPTNHPLQVYLGQHYDDMLSFRPIWDIWKPALRPQLHLARGVYHCKYIANVVNDFWRRQGLQQLPVQLESPFFISSSINMGRAWEPILDDSFLSFYKVYEYCGVSPNTRVGSDVVDGGRRSLGGTGSGGASGGGNQFGSDTNRTTNATFNSLLFSTYKQSQVRCADIRRAITAGTKPALPTSKVDTQQPMCLAWHTKGQCNNNCPRSSDHVAYSVAEYQPLVTWCTANYLN